MSHLDSCWGWRDDIELSADSWRSVSIIFSHSVHIRVFGRVSPYQVAMHVKDLSNLQLISALDLPGIPGVWGEIHHDQTWGLTVEPARIMQLSNKYIEIWPSMAWFYLEDQQEMVTGNRLVFPCFKCNFSLQQNPGNVLTWERGCYLGNFTDQNIGFVGKSEGSNLPSFKYSDKGGCPSIQCQVWWTNGWTDGWTVPAIETDDG